MTYTPTLLQEYGECAGALKEAERLLEADNPDAEKLSRIERILSAESKAMILLRNHREYGPKVADVIERIKPIMKLGKSALEAKAMDEYYNLKIEQPHTAYYLISNMPVAGRKYNVWLSKQPLDNGALYSYDEWPNIENRDGWALPDTKLFHAIMRAVYYGAKSSDEKLKAGSLELRGNLMKCLAASPLMTATSVGKAISMQGTETDESGRILYTRDNTLVIDSKNPWLLFHGDDFLTGIKTLFQADVKEAEGIYHWFPDKIITEGIQWPVVLALTLPKDYGIVTLCYEKSFDEGGPYIQFHVNANTPKGLRAKAMGVKLFNINGREEREITGSRRI